MGPSCRRLRCGLRAVFCLSAVWMLSDHLSRAYNNSRTESGRKFKSVYSFHMTVLVSTVCAILILMSVGRIFILFHPQIFRRPWADFCETLPHDAVCSEIDYVLWPAGIYICPLKFACWKTPMFADLRTQMDTISPTVPHCEGNREI